MDERLGACEDGGRRLCFLSVSLTTPRWVLALRSREGCDSQPKLDEKEKEDVVGRTKGYGMAFWNINVARLFHDAI
jgi:hypothetical protein